MMHGKCQSTAKFDEKCKKNPITVSRVGPRWPTLDKNEAAGPIYLFIYLMLMEIYMDSKILFIPLE